MMFFLGITFLSLAENFWLFDFRDTSQWTVQNSKRKDDIQIMNGSNVNVFRKSNQLILAAFLVIALFLVLVFICVKNILQLSFLFTSIVKFVLFDIVQCTRSNAPKFVDWLTFYSDIQFIAELKMGFNKYQIFIFFWLLVYNNSKQFFRFQMKNENKRIFFESMLQSNREQEMGKHKLHDFKKKIVYANTKISNEIFVEKARK